MELVEVTARFDSQGQITPLAFIWKGISYPVDASGRRWEDERGQHMLVMIPGGRTFELLYAPLEKVWYLTPISPGPMLG